MNEEKIGQMLAEHTKEVAPTPEMWEQIAKETRGRKLARRWSGLWPRLGRWAELAAVCAMLVGVLSLPLLRQESVHVPPHPAPAHPSETDPPVTDPGEPALSVPQLMLATLRDMQPDDAVSAGDQWGIPGLAVACHGSAADSEEEVPVLVCQWGKGYNLLTDGKALFWWQAGTWHFQPYPSDVLQGFVKRIQQNHEHLIVVTNIRVSRTAEEVHLLRRTSEGWILVWQPDETVDYNRYAEVLVSNEGDRFTLFEWLSDSYTSAFREEWQRFESEYIRTSREPLSVQEVTAVRFLSALIRSDEISARNLSGTHSVLEQANDFRIGELASSGYRTAPGLNPEDIYVFATRTDKADWRFLLEKSGEELVVVAIEPVQNQ